MISVFISYSWDSPQHRDWVALLTNSLRGTYGIDASFDGSENFANLYQMMVDKIQSVDKVVIVVTKNYTDKANSHLGGVGTETQLLYQSAFHYPDKILVVMKEKADLPFYLNGFQYTDFSQGSFEKNVEDLVRRLQDIPPYVMAPITSTPKKVTGRTVDANDMIADLDIVTPEDARQYLVNEFSATNECIRCLMTRTKDRYPSLVYNIKEFKDLAHTNSFDIVDGELVEHTKTYTVSEVSVSYHGKKALYRLWMIDDRSLAIAGILNPSDGISNQRYYNAYSLYVPVSSENNKLSISCITPFGEEITSGKKFGEYVYQELMKCIKP